MILPRTEVLMIAWMAKLCIVLGPIASQRRSSVDFFRYLLPVIEHTKQASYIRPFLQARESIAG
jgi:hypothetical protein